MLVDLAAPGSRQLIGALQNGVGERGGEQVAVLERDALLVDGVDALSLGQADDVGLAALDDADVGADRVEFLRDVVAAGAGAEHQRLSALPRFWMVERSGMRDSAGEVL